jgi:hypothetical protein
MTSIDRLQGVRTSKAIKAPALVATTANITLNGTQTIDGVAVVAEDRVLVKDQTDATENGIYAVANGDWSRARDFNKDNDISRGTKVRVNTGDAGAGLDYALTTSDPVIGTSNIAFTVDASGPTVTLNTRADFIAADLSVLSDGDTVFVRSGQLTFEKSTGATTLADKSDWIPVAPWASGHYGIVHDGATDQAAKLNALFAYASANGGGRVTIAHEALPIAAASDVRLSENLISDWQSPRIDNNSLPSIQWTSDTAGLIWERGHFLENFYSVVATANQSTYTGPSLTIEDSGVDANIGAPIAGSQIAIVGGSGQLATGIYSVEKVTFAHLDYLYLEDFLHGFDITPSTGNWFNSNRFTNFFAYNCKHVFTGDTTNGTISGNYFSGAVQCEASIMKRGFNISGIAFDNNVVDLYWWDPHTLVAKDGETSPVIIDFGAAGSHRNELRNNPGQEYIINRRTESYSPSAYVNGNEDGMLHGALPPTSRYSDFTDFDNDNLAYAGSSLNPNFTITNSTLASGDIANPFIRNSDSGACKFSASGADTWKAVALKFLTGDPTVLKGLLTNWLTVPLEVQYWYATIASPTFAQLEGAEGSITDWTKLTPVFRENTNCLMLKDGQTNTTMKHIAVRFLVEDGSTVDLQEFCGVWPDLTFGRYYERDGNPSRLNLGGTTELTIATGAITLTSSDGSRIRVDTESDAATDDLDTISGGTDGDVIVLRAESSVRTVVVKHNTGNIRLDGSTDKSLTQVNDRIVLEFDGTNWLQWSFADNSA